MAVEEHERQAPTADAAGAATPDVRLANLSRPNQLPIVNVVAVLVILLSFVPVWLAQRLSQESAGPAATGVAGGAR